MPFKFKLSRRLAQIYYSAAALSAATAAGCTSDIASNNPVLTVASLEVSPSNLTLNVGESGQLSAITHDPTGFGVAASDVTWTSNDTTVAQLDQSGLVTARASGTVLVTALSKGRSGTASVSVARVPVASVEVSPSSATVSVGASVQLSAVAKDNRSRVLAGRTATWSTSDSAVARVSSGGLVTGTAAGSATISATSEGASGTSDITVTTTPVASVTVSPASASIVVGQAVQLAATLKDVNGNVLAGPTVTWTSSAPAIAGVSTGGLVTGTGAGSATITGTSEGVSGTGAVAVTAATPGQVTDLAVLGTSDSGVTLAFTEVDDGTGQPASYDVRYAPGTLTWGVTAPSVSLGTCTTPVAGIAIGNKRTCTVLGLLPATGYQFRLVAFRGTLKVNAVSGALSNVTNGSTTSSVTSGAPAPGPTDTIIFQDGFEAGDLSAWTQSPNTGRYSISTNATRVHSGAQSLQVLFTPTNTYGLITRWFMPGYDEIYVKFWVQFEENFDESYGLHFFTVCGDNINNSGSCWGQPGVKPNGTDFFYAGMDPEFISGDALLKPLHFYSYWPDMTCPADYSPPTVTDCYGNRFYQAVPKLALVPGQWQEVVVHVKLNTPGQADGSQELWINGVKQISVQNLRWRTTTDLRLNEIIFFDWMSQGPTTEHLWLDDLTVWRP